MEIRYRGLTIALADDDPRVVIMEALLFGRTLPPPIVLPEPPPAPVVPPVPVPPSTRALWLKLGLRERRELAKLAERPWWRPAEIEQALGLTQREIMGSHSKINRAAGQVHSRVRVGVSGRGRLGRKYSLHPSHAPAIRALAAEPPGV